MHFVSYELSQPAIRRLARKVQVRQPKPDQKTPAATSRLDALEHAMGLAIVPVLAIALHVSRGQLGLLPLDLLLLAAAAIIGRARLLQKR